MAFNIDEVLAEDARQNAAKPKGGFDIDQVLAMDAQRQNPGGYLQDLQAGLLETPGYQPQPGFMHKAAYLGGKYGPTAIGGTLGTMAPGGGTALGLGLGAGAGAAMGRSLQNLTQAVSNQVSPYSAPQKTPGQLVTEPTTDALGQALLTGMASKLAGAAKQPIGEYVSAETGVKPNLVKRAMEHLDKVFSSGSVKAAGQELGDAASKAGIKTGNEGYKLATASMLGKEAATDEISTATTLKMASMARDAGLDTMSPQELYSTAEGLRKAMSAPKYADPHGPFSQNFRMYAAQLSQIEDKLEEAIPGYAEKRMGYVNALAKEAFSSWGPLNKNMTISQLKTAAGVPMTLLGLNKARKGDYGEAAGLLLSAAMMSPLMMGGVLRAGSAGAQTGVPQLAGRMGVAAGTNTLENALGQ